MSRKYFLKEKVENPRIPECTIRSKIVIKYRALLETYGDVELHKQFFKMMQFARDNGEFITKGEAIAILREKLKFDQPTKRSHDHMNFTLHQFRKWIGVVGGMIVYAQQATIGSKRLKEWIYQPIKNKRDYEKIVGKHIKMVKQGLTDRDIENRALLSMTQKQINDLIEEKSREIDHEVEFRS